MPSALPWPLRAGHFFVTEHAPPLEKSGIGYAVA